MFSEYLKEKHGYSEPIYVEDIKYKSYSRAWIFLELKKLVDSGELKRFCKGIYYFPEKTPWGDSKLNPRKVIERRFISDGDEVYGYIAGLSLLNMTALSTQVPNLIEIVTNKETTRVRDIMVGNLCARARRSRTAITKENASTLQLLDLMNIITPSDMDETEQFMLRKYIKASGVTRNNVMRYARFFPAKAMKNMMESGAAYELA
ncbi:MAG: hypothetical protein FWG53_09650 [Clostridiales bacterium]|nr:hypothetical protein [Clostridiales bacterium]